MYIAIEGVKGTGKSTVLNYLVEQLTIDGIKFDTFCPTRAMPTHTWWEQAKDRFMNDPQFIEDLYTARANYHAAQVDFSTPLVIGDRSILTSMVTRWPTQKQLILPHIHKIQLQEYLVPKPDVVCYLNAPIDVINQRLVNRQRDYGKQDETIDRLLQVQQAYDELFCSDRQYLKNLQMVKINANKKIKIVFQELYFYVKKHININLV